MTDNTMTITITRIFEASVDRVWQAWTESEPLRRWWGPTGFTAPVANLNVVEGGTSLVSMRSPEGHEIYNTWTYQAVVPRQRLAFVQRFADQTGQPSSPIQLGLPLGIPEQVPHILLFKDLGNGQTELTVTEQGYASADIAETSKAGMNQCLDKLAAILTIESNQTNANDMEENTLGQQGPPAPASELNMLDTFIGTWELTGKTLDATENNIRGRATFSWLPGKFFLQQDIELNFMGFPVKSHELVGYDPATETFPSMVYSNMWGQPIPYIWAVEGNRLTITMPGMATYTGSFSADGQRMSGGWRPNPGQEGPGNIPYDIWGERVKESN